MRKVFHVWDFDPMDGSMGRDYLAASFANQTDAEAEVVKRNNAWKKWWIENATDGAERLNETWNWRHAHMTSSELK